MKKVTAIMAACAIITACEADFTKTDPVCASIADRFLEANDNVKHLSIRDFAIADSVSVEEELANKVGIFTYKNKKAGAKYSFYSESRKELNARKWAAEAKKYELILQKLDSLKDAKKCSLSQTLYYCIRFNGYAKLYNGKVIQLKDWWATVSADNRAFNVQKDDVNLKAAMGELLPGYSEILKSVGADEEDKGQENQ